MLTTIGYVDKDQNVLGWINELAFAPVDLQEDAMQDEWSTDYGVGCKYFSQDAVIKLAPWAGIEIPEDLPLAQKLKFVQKLMEADDERAIAIFETIGAFYSANDLTVFMVISVILVLLWAVAVSWVFPPVIQV